MEIPSEHYQHILEAVAAVLHLDVALINSDLVRIAGTGPYRQQVGERVHPTSAAGQALVSGNQVRIENPRMDPICQHCGSLATCREAAYVATPLWNEGKPIGVLGLTAFGHGQRHQLLAGAEEYAAFLDKISLLIAGNMREERTLKELLQAQGSLQAMAHSVLEGLVAVDRQGRITFLNGPARRLLRLNGPGLPAHIADLPGLDEPVQQVLGGGQPISDQEFRITTGGAAARLIGNVQPIVVQGEIAGAVASLRDIGAVHRLVYRMSAAQPAYGFERIVYCSRAMERAVEQGRRMAGNRSTVLIQGESGTGKELFARAIHAESPRQSGPFIAVNCAAIPEELLESELFGYADGAFTGARRGGKPGKFELANQGTLFLDEIGDMSLRLQAKLLRVVQELEVERLGGTEALRLDVRILAATNRDLDQMVARKEFREDLYFRLNVIPLEIPPVRLRREDIPVLVEHFLRRTAAAAGKPPLSVSGEALPLLMRYDWPGNVREIQNAMEYAVAMVSGPEIGPDALPARIRGEAPAAGSGSPSGLRALAQVEREALERGLREYGSGERAIIQIAKELGLSRATVYRRLHKYGLGTPGDRSF